MQQTHNILDIILLFDGIAIFLIVLLHALDLSGQTNNPLNSVCSYIGVMGLSLFTFSSGYKLMINHSNKLGQRIFLNEYYIKRFVRLYKPYIGYTLLTVFPVLLLSYFAVHFFHIENTELSIFTIKISSTITNMSIFNLLNFLCGDNLIASQLWYLVTLIVITSICFTILYFLNIKWLFLSFIPFFLISLLIEFGIVQKFGIIQNISILKIFIYLPFFILGSYWAYNQQHQMGKWFRIAQFLLPVFFLIFIIFTIILKNFSYNSILIYFCCLSLPALLLSIFDHVKKIKFLYPFIIFCGTYSFQIYLFHFPLILSILCISIINILKIDYIFMPIIISIIAIYFCVIVYKIVKMVHLNNLFE